MDKLESMVLEAETVSALMIHLADDDVGDTSFAVMSDLGENGTEHECDLGVHETALRASAVIDALLADLDEAQKESVYFCNLNAQKNERIADLEAIATEYAGKFQNAQDAAKHLVIMNDSAQAEIAHLKTLLATPVRLPTKSQPTGNYEHDKIAFHRASAIDNCALAIRAAGFNCEGDE